MNRSKIREHGLKDDLGRDPAVLEREANEARADLERTLEALEHRLSPREVLDRAVGYLKDNGKGFGENLVTQVRDHPVPSLLTGVGVSWLMAADHRSERNGGNGSHGKVMDRARSAAEQTRSAAGSVARTTRDAAGSVAHASREGMRRTRDGYEYLYREQPLVLGALAVAIGAGIAALLPRSGPEDRLMGRTSARIKEEGRRRTEEVRETAAGAAEPIRESAGTGRIEHDPSRSWRERRERER